MYDETVPPGDPRRQAYRASILHFLDDPRDRLDAASYRYLEDGLLIVEGGRVLALGPAPRLLARSRKALRVTRYPGCLILPGFVDCHAHYPQTEMLASYGKRLLDWLQSYAYPAERRYGDMAYARRAARAFLREMLRNGATSSMVFGTVHAASAEAIFQEAERLNLRLVAGKVSMDRNVPFDLRDSPASAYHEGRALIRKWHGRGRLSYAVTPRFAPSCSERELLALSRLRKEFPDVHVHTHLSESREEVAWARRLFPGSRDYLGIYEKFGLTGPRSLFAHCIHLSDSEWRRLAASGSAAAFCPSSNLFLGSGLFDLSKAARHGAKVGLGTDIGAGTSFSLLRNLEAAYQISQLRGRALTPLRAFYLATLGGARALGLDSHIGNFLGGKEADFTVLDPRATPLLRLRARGKTTMLQRLFLLLCLGDDRCTRATYVMGRLAYRRKNR